MIDTETHVHKYENLKKLSFKEKWKNFFKKDELEQEQVYETRRKKQLDLRIHRKLRATSNLKEKAEEILKKSIFENFLLLNSEDQKNHRVIAASEFNTNQNKFYKDDVLFFVVKNRLTKKSASFT